MPDVNLGSLKVSNRTEKRLKSLVYIISDALELPCTVVDTKRDEVVFQYPPNHINACFCKRLETVTGNHYSINHFLERCHRVGVDSNNSIYNCPFGLINILVPVFDNDEYIAALQIGPFIFEDSEKLLLRHGMSDLDISSPSEVFQGVLRYLRSLPKGTTDYLVTVTRVAKTCFTDDAIDIQLSEPSLEDAPSEGKDVDYDLIYAFVRQPHLLGKIQHRVQGLRELAPCKEGKGAAQRHQQAHRGDMPFHRVLRPQLFQQGFQALGGHDAYRVQEFRGRRR